MNALSGWTAQSTSSERNQAKREPINSPAKTEESTTAAPKAEHSTNQLLDLVLASMPYINRSNPDCIVASDDQYRVMTMAQLRDGSTEIVVHQNTEGAAPESFLVVPQKS
jgi:hypothetical protein